MAEVSLTRAFGGVIRQMRTALGLSQEGFAYRCGISRTYMTRLERGEKMASLDTVAKLAKGLGVEISDLFLEVERQGATVDKVTDSAAVKWS